MAVVNILCNYYSKLLSCQYIKTSFSVIPAVAIVMCEACASMRVMDAIYVGPTSPW